MPRLLLLFAAWLLAATFTSLGAWQGVGFIGAQVVSERPDSLDARGVRQAYDEVILTVEPSSADEVSIVAGDSPASVVAGPSVQPTLPPAASPAARPANPGRAADSAPTKSEPSNRPQPTLPVAVPKVTVPAVATPVVRNYTLTGGTVSLRYTADGVTVAFANPKAGYRTETKQLGSGVRVEFNNGEHRSRVTGRWESGAVDEVQEQSLVRGRSSENLKENGGSR